MIYDESDKPCLEFNIMKDINYFLDFESRYIEENSPFEWVWNDEIGELGPPYDPLHFLQDRPFEKFSGTEVAKKAVPFNLSYAERLMLHLFIGSKSRYFRDDHYVETPDIVKEMQLVLDSVIAKAPLFTGNTLYRFTKDDKVDFEIGDTYAPSHSLTTTTDDWEQDKDTYVITPLPIGATKAHSLYLIYNNGENQVNFERGAKFQVTDIKKRNGFKLIYMNEIN